VKLFFKIVFSVFAVIGILLVSVTALLFLPSFQQLLKREAVDTLSEELQTEVAIDSISLSLPTGSIALFGVDCEDQKGEQMLHADEVYGKMRIMELLKQRVDISDIKLKGTTANIYKEEPDSAANYQFLLDAFAKTEEDDKKEKSKVSFDIKNVEITDTELHWAIHSDPNSKVHAKLNKAEYSKGDNQIVIQGLTSQYKGNNITLKKVEFNTESQSGTLSEFKAVNRGNSFSIDKVECDSLKHFQIEDIRLYTDNDKPRKNAGKPKHGAFDIGHMDIHSNMRLTAHKLQKDNIIVHIDKLYAEDRASGLRADSLSCLMMSDTKSAVIHNLFVRDQNTILSIEQIRINDFKSFAFSNSTLYAKTQLADISKPFSPVLKDFTTPLELTTNVSGDKDHLNFSNINIRTLDDKLKVKAAGRIDSLSSHKGVALTFDVEAFSARNDMVLKLVNHFPVKQSMMGVLKKIGDVGYKGTVYIPYMRQEFAGLLKTNVGSADVVVKLNNYTRYLEGNISSDSINLGRLIDNPNLGNLSFSSDFKFDISGPESAKKLGRYRGTLPVGSAKGVARSARYRKMVLRNTYFDISSDGNIASGSVRVATALVDFLCKYKFADTNFPSSLKVKPSLRFHKMTEEAKQKKAEKKQKKAEKKAAKAKHSS